MDSGNAKMGYLESGGFDKLLIYDGHGEHAIPDWAKGLIWLGEHVRCFDYPGERLVSLVVLPRREYASLFVALGALIGGISTSKVGLNWSKFSSLDPQTRVYWRSPDGIRLAGEIVGVISYQGESLISVKPDSTRGRKYQDAEISISKNNFDSYQFSTNKFISEAKLEERIQALEIFRPFFGDKVDVWKNDDTCETLIVGEKNRIATEIESLRFKKELDEYNLDGVLQCADANKGVLSKTKIVSPRSDNVSVPSKIVIADGVLAFQARDHFSGTSNLVFLMDRLSISQDFLDFYCILRDHYGDLEWDQSYSCFPKQTVAMEIASFRARL